MGIIIKSEREIAIMRQAGRIVATVLDILSQKVRPGMKTKELDIIAAGEVERLGAKPSFKGYRGFPAISASQSMMKWCTGFRGSEFCARVI